MSPRRHDGKEGGRGIRGDAPTVMRTDHVLGVSHENGELRFSRAGKPLLLKRIPNNRAGLRVAFSVNDMNEGRINAAILPAALAGHPA